MTNLWPEGRLMDTDENRQALLSRTTLETAWRSQTILEGLAVRCDPSHQLYIQCGDFHGVIPREECALGIREGTARDIAILTCVGKPTSFVITGFEDGVPQLSRRRAQELALEQLLKDAVPGDILPATVTHLEPYGAFVDIGRGVPSLIPLKTISVSRIPHPNCRFRPGQQIYALVREVLPEQRRIQLSHKELLGTWTENVEAFQPGETVTGIVRSVMDYGIFVELSPNLTGLAEPLEGFLPGDTVSVYIKSILPEKQKIKLAVIGHAAPLPLPLPLTYTYTQGRIENWSYSDAATEVTLPE
ncbi:MAG: RNA-binding protein [Clostridiales bacterium]|jgi:small subunit ribosomal protein S1|nr:MAG: RNA-binding protein [Clostridiales bacterium]